MKVTRELKVSSLQFFELLDKYFIGEFKANSKKKLVKSGIAAGLKYSKKLNASMGNSSEVFVELIEYVPLKKYVSKISNAKSEYTISYEIEDTADGILATYSEESVFVKKIDKWNFNLVSFLYKNKTERKMLSHLVSIEAEILKSNSGQENKADNLETEIVLDDVAENNQK